MKYGYAILEKVYFESQSTTSIVKFFYDQQMAMDFVERMNAWSGNAIYEAFQVEIVESE